MNKTTSENKPGKEKKWQVINEAGSKQQEVGIEQVIEILLKNRGITKEKKDEFLNPKLESVTIEKVGIDQEQLKLALKRIKQAVEEKQQIIVFGDYDVDGICGSAILWETLHDLGANVTPYIPHRIDEGYGLSVKGIDNLPEETKLIITVDNGIVANLAVEYANQKNIDVIITDHHAPPNEKNDLPKALAIVHTTKLCGTAVGYMLSLEIKKLFHAPTSPDTHLELVALATIADLVPLTESSRVLTKFGLEALTKTKRLGLLALFQEAGLDKNVIGTYEVGHLIAPRLNAMGRIESAMDSLRLLCTKSSNRARELATLLGETNKQRQALTIEAVQHAKQLFLDTGFGKDKLIVLGHESYEPGVIGLVAGKMVEEYYLPSIILSIGETHAKASARSVTGLNMIELIRVFSHLLVDGGGHPMAAGFTVTIENLPALTQSLKQHAEGLITEEMLIRTIKIDCEVPISLISNELERAVRKLEPFGMGNYEPVFTSKNVTLSEIRTIGKEAKHIKVKFETGTTSLEAVGFSLAEKAKGLKPGNKIDIAYTVDENTWNGRTSLQLKLKDFKRIS